MIRAVILGVAWLVSILGTWYLGYALGYSDGRDAPRLWSHESLYRGEWR